MDSEQIEDTIRPGDERDLPAVLALMDGAVVWLAAQGRTGQWGSEPGRHAATTTLVRDSDLYVAVNGDDVIGALAVGAAPDYVPPAVEPELYVRLLVTDRSRPGRGIGGRLLEHAGTLARAKGVDLVRVDCYAGPDRALVRYYERQGFTATDAFEVARPSKEPWPGQVLERRLR
ncbi:GCN5 family N-acetyltransferase [Actinoplanes italicus]|uniref:L-amino acid N-acyltransferase YncA n=1 Tax=Actinoplanes italicus TaxID=113567 RepID=A0A2T0KFV2_9ACTN|nr:GNAT family N-acetyltransferase [Actinoplanes italicus]PRX22250.1 L-amino acid N-acyltransferase YncA [Actinoplanes italicus]GIE29330.1 GCN5 family N-acetyltransferase [Actinoplanes italicus]